MQAPPLAALASNAGAIELVQRFVKGSESRVVLAGPSGWGKSHLLALATEQLSAKWPRCHTVSALDWCHEGIRNEPPGPAVIDDLQDLAVHPRHRHTLKHRLLRRARSGYPTLLACTCDARHGSSSNLLPSGNSWAVSEIACPSEAERIQVAHHIARNNGIVLSEPVARLIGRHLNGNGRSITGAVQLLALVKSRWSDPEDVLPACGILSPYLLGAEGWDPRDHAFDAVKSVASLQRLPFKTTELCSYILLYEMKLGESDVASFFRVSPAVVYRRAEVVKRSFGEDGAIRALEACRNAVLSGFVEV